VPAPGEVSTDVGDGRGLDNCNASDVTGGAVGHCAVTDLANEAARNPHGMLMRLPLTAALAPLVHPRGGSGTPAVLDHSRALPQSLACCAGGSGEHLGRVFPWLLVNRKTFARCEPFSFWPHNGPSLAVLSLGHFGDRPEESEQRKTRQYCADNSDCNELRPHCHEPGSQHSCLD